MAAAQNGSMLFRGMQSGRVYVVDNYNADSGAGVLSTFNTSGAAGAASSTYWRAPENVILQDFSYHTGTTQPGIVLTENGALKNGGVLRFAVHLDTLNNRPRLAIPFPAGALIGATSL